MRDESGFRLRRRTRDALAATLALICLTRLALAVKAAGAGDIGPAQAYGFAVLFPAGLAAALLATRPTRSAEGMLMRVACVIQLGAVAFAPPLAAARLLLGLPVVFLVVESWERWAPVGWREWAGRLWLEQPPA
jgi:hypothetical protein